MKKSLITLLLAAFCCTAFAMDHPLQDTTRVKHKTMRKMGKRTSPTDKKKKSWKNMDSMSRDTIHRAGRADTAVRPPH